jgi:hypothetical protein
MAARELFPAPMTWPMLMGTSLYVGLGDTIVLLPEGWAYLKHRSVLFGDKTSDWTYPDPDG